MITSAKDFLSSLTKDITLPSGVVFRIRKVNARELVLKGRPLPVEKLSQIKAKCEQLAGALAEKNPETSKITPDQMAKNILDSYSSMDVYIREGTVFPQITYERISEDILCIDDLSDEEYSFLYNEISKFSTIKRQDLKSFRADQQPTNS